MAAMAARVTITSFAVSKERLEFVMQISHILDKKSQINAVIKICEGLMVCLFVQTMEKRTPICYGLGYIHEELDVLSY